jgi:transposase-like protein
MKFLIENEILLKDEVSRYGRCKNKPRYICESRRKTFTDFTLLPKHNSKYDVDIWLHFA